jgi:hypothetical protein
VTTLQNLQRGDLRKLEGFNRGHEESPDLVKWHHAELREMDVEQSVGSKNIRAKSYIFHPRQWTSAETAVAVAWQRPTSLRLVRPGSHLAKLGEVGHRPALQGLRAHRVKLW